MVAGIWTSIGLAAGIALLYGAAAHLMLGHAMRQRGQRFLSSVLGGMLARMVGLLLLVGVTLYLVTVEALPFALTLAGLLLACMTAEMLRLTQHVRSSSTS